MNWMEDGATPGGSGVQDTFGNRIEPQFLIRVSSLKTFLGRRTRASRQVTPWAAQGAEIPYMSSGTKSGPDLKDRDRICIYRELFGVLTISPPLLDGFFLF